ncbi:hypothetical protein M3Y98_00803000 [Aphelenchoides besseyi]|nr:hypothetical protein M3Y98_00803000 [Aphelenchoides besseyi]KAI6212058.1 hypothetical protein M3Y96_00500000 [Aphelenchoides besseyi]
MLVEPEMSIASRRFVEELKQLQRIFVSKCSNCELNEEQSTTILLSQFPTELLLQIFSHVSPTDLASIGQVCRRFTEICNVHRQSLARVPVTTLAVRYGQWRDVLKDRRRKDCNNLLTYRVSNGIRTQSKRGYRRNFLFGSTPQPVPFDTVLRNCRFETTLITVEMLNGEMQTALRLNTLDSTYVYIDFSHHSLHVHSILRYLPTLAVDLNSNPQIQNVDLIFRSTSNVDECKLEKTISSNIQSKRVSVLFVEMITKYS